jgi:hypothetical protein
MVLMARWHQSSTDGRAVATASLSKANKLFQRARTWECTTNRCAVLLLEKTAQSATELYP